MPQWFLLMLPQLIGGLSKLIASKTAVDRMNRYNSPIEQIRRVRAAGLPFAAYATGQSGNQSQMPDLSGFDTLGSAIGTGINQSNQIQMFKELLRKAGADADIFENLRDVSNVETDAVLKTTYKGPNGEMIPIAGANKLLDFQLKEYGAWSAKYKADMDKIDKEIKEKRYASGQLDAVFDEEFQRLINTNKAMQQAWDSNDKQNRAFQRIIDTMSGSDGRLGFMEALLIEFIKAIGGGFSTGPKGGSMNFSY